MSGGCGGNVAVSPPAKPAPEDVRSCSWRFRVTRNVEVSEMMRSEGNGGRQRSVDSNDGRRVGGGEGGRMRVFKLPERSSRGY